MNIAIVHERLDVVGGAEKVILALHQIFPNAPIYTSFVDRNKLSPEFRNMDIRTSYMQGLPTFLKRRSDKLLPFYMLAFQDFDLSEYDVVISSSYVAAKSVLTSINTCHICYCHTPMRFAWDLYPDFIRPARGKLMKVGLRVLLQYFRMWDVQTSNNVDYFICNSETVRQRIRKHYRREAHVIYPPVETDRFFVSEAPENYYLVVSRLVPYKRVDIAVDAFNQNGRELVVIGSGREFNKLSAKAKPNVKMLGWQPDEVVARSLSQAKALVFPGEEDFGILPVEAQASGTPVVAYGKGGILETVRHRETGYFFENQTVESLNDAVERSENCRFDRHYIARHARQFDTHLFHKRMQTAVKEFHAEFRMEKAKSDRFTLGPVRNGGEVMDLDSHAAVGAVLERRGKD